MFAVLMMLWFLVPPPNIFADMRCADDTGYPKAEAVFIGWFTFELLLRFIVSPDKWQFCQDFLNVIDLVAIVPFFVGLAMAANNTSLSYLRVSTNRMHKALHCTALHCTALCTLCAWRGYDCCHGI